MSRVYKYHIAGDFGGRMHFFYDFLDENVDKLNLFFPNGLQKDVFFLYVTSSGIVPIFVTLQNGLHRKAKKFDEKK